MCQTELLTCLNAILASVSLPRITHILDATPNLLIALYELLYQKRIPLVDRTPKSHTSFNSRVKNVKLLIGTIAHEANISAESAARLGEIDPLKVCQKDEDTVRELLWALVRIGILHRIQNQRLTENISPRKPFTLHRPVYAKETRVISGESGNALSVLHKSLERRKELAGIQSANPRASHSRLKTCSWLDDLPSSFSTLSKINDDSTIDPPTATQPRKQVTAQKTLLKVSGHALVGKSMGHASSHSARPHPSAPKSSLRPSPKSSKAQIKPILQKPISRKTSQSLKPNSYPHAVYNVSFDEMPTESAEISPVSTVYLEHVSARIMEISNRVLPVARISQFPGDVSEHAESPKTVSLSPQEHLRTVSGPLGIVRKLKQGSDMPLKNQDKNAPFHEQKTDKVAPIMQTALRSNSFLRALVPIHLENALDHTLDAGAAELQLAPDSPLSTTHSIEKVGKTDETSRNPTNSRGTMPAYPTVEAMTQVTEEYEEHDSEAERGYDNDIMDETHDAEDYASDEDQTLTRPSGRHETAEGTREDDASLPVWEDETNDLTEDTQSREDSQLEGSNLKCSMDRFEHPDRHGHDSAASREALLATPLTANEESFQTDPDEQGHVSITSSEHKNASQIEEASANVDVGVGIYTNNQRPEPLLIDVDIHLPAHPAAPSMEGNLIDLLSDPIPIGISPILCAIGPTRPWLAAPRDLRSESRDGVINSLPITNGSNLLLDGFDLSSALQTMVLQAGEDSACAVPLPESEVFSLDSSSVSSIVVHQGTQTEASPVKNTIYRIISNKSLPLPGPRNGKPGSDMQIATDKGKHREVDNSGMGSSPLLDDAPSSPAQSDSAWPIHSPLQPNEKFSLGSVFTSTPKKNPTRKPSDPSIHYDEAYEEGEDGMASNAAGDISLLDIDTELDELSQELSEYHIASRDRSPTHKPSPLRRSVRSGKVSPSIQRTPSKGPATATRRPDTPTKLISSFASALDAASSTWETEDDYLGQEEDEEDPEQPTTQGSNPSGNSPITEELHKRQMQQMQSIIQNWDQAGSSQPLRDDENDSDNVADDEESETSHEQHEEDSEYTITSGSQFSNGVGLEDVFADEPETPVPASRHKQTQKNRDLRLLSLSPPPQWSGFGPFHEVEPQTPLTPLRPRRLFSTPVPAKLQGQEKSRGESRSFVLEKSPGLTIQGLEVGNRSLPTTFPPTMRLSPTPVLSKSLTLGRHNRISNSAHDKPRSASLFNRRTPPPSLAANNNTRPSTPMNQNANRITPLPSIHPPKTAQMSKMSSRKSSIGISTPGQAGNISLPSIQPPSAIVMSRLMSRGGGATPAGAQGTPSMSVYYTPASGVGSVVGSVVKMGGGGTDLLDMDLSYGLM